MALVCWVVSSGAPGMEKQAIALANAFFEEKGDKDHKILIKRVQLRAPWRWVSPYVRLGISLSYTPRFKAPWPDILIASGNAAILPALHVKRASLSTKVVYLQNPRIDPSYFDAVICPAHDGLVGENVIPMLGTPTWRDEVAIQASLVVYEPILKAYPAPRYAVLVGGPTRRYQMTAAWIEGFVQYVTQLSHRGGSLWITPSRRTPNSLKVRLKELCDGVPNSFFDHQNGQNPYLAFLEMADALILTGDSISMITEACATSKPVYVAKLPGKNSRFDRFYDAIQEKGRIDFLPLLDLGKGEMGLLGEKPVGMIAALNDTKGVAQRLVNLLGFVNSSYL